MNTLVMKFGGSSIGTTTALTQVLSIVLHEREQWGHLVLVVSALEGVTDALIEAAHLAELGQHRGYRRIVANLRTRHLSLIEELPLGTTERTALSADIDRLLFDMLDIYQSMSQAASMTGQAGIVDATIGVGEKIAARIIAALLRQNNLRSVAIDTTSLIITDDVYGNATPNIPLTRVQIAENLLPLLDRNIVPVVTGFIGATSSGKPTTLGRGGSDYTASVLGVCVEATEIWIWTDVDGMMTADPRDFDNAQVIPALSYTEAAELAYFGARVLHARMIAPVQAQKIPLHIKNVYKPQKVGTIISGENPRKEDRIKAVTYISGLVVQTKQSGMSAHISAILEQTLASVPNSQLDIVISSQSSMKGLTCFLIPTTAGPDAVHTMRVALEAVLAGKPETQSWSVQPVTIITAIKNASSSTTQMMAKILSKLTSVPIIAVTQGPSDCNFSIVVESLYAENAIYEIHDLIINNG
ncbi:MAG: aspartate kinase [Anaerolineae bacterium]|nr:aspartate kinase [Anaerolineae bacterium]